MATLDDIDLYGDGLATELNVSQSVSTPVVSAPYIKPEPTPQIKLEPTTMVTPTLPFPPPAAISVKQEPVPAPSLPAIPIAGMPGVTYVTQDTFAQQNRHQYIDPNDPKSRTVYVGNLTWWTTDQDLIHACASLNVRDVSNIKFYENRTNGQSKGYCAIDVGSLNSAKTLMHELRNVTIHNEHPYVAIASKTPLYYFETALGIKNDDKNKKVGFDPAVPPSMPAMPPRMPPLPLPGMPGLPPPGMPPPGMPRMPPPPPGCPLPPPMPLPNPHMGITPMLPPPPNLARPPPMALPRPMMPAMPFAPLSVPVSQIAPPPVSISAAHVNPAFLPAAAKPEDSMSEQEKVEMIDKNHQVCKTAILRAYESCDARDYDQAEGTVAAALKIIKMSAVSDDSKSKAFISDLEECLAYVQKRQKKSKQSGRSGSHRRTERTSEKKAERSSDRRRTRSRSQEENRDRKRDKRSDRSDNTRSENSRSDNTRSENSRSDNTRSENSRSDNSRSYNDRSKDYEDYKELRRRELI